jgi:UDP-N-acetylmuramoyl-L-alanyl-D-glutamate--2,6-diaminopimelate ligase
MLQPAKNYFHLLQAIRAVRKYKNPANGLTIIGVTGTDGKTTTASLIYHILRNTGYKTALISTVAAYIEDKKYDTGFHVSTPDSLVLQSYIAKAKKAGVTHIVLEVTSHALDQYRVYGIPFAIGVLTNISHEHLDYHQTMENYMLAKAKLFERSEVAIINRDDDSYKFMITRLKNKKVVSYGLGANADSNLTNHSFKTLLPGKFNQLNILAALTVADILEIDSQKAANAVSSFKLPEGRIEVVYERDFKVIIDFAHTPNALKNILETLKDTKSSGRIIHVFGSAGERDLSKRPLMGEISRKLSDIIILTSEDPRGESSEKIADDIKSGMQEKTQNLFFDADRQQAINLAIQMAQKGDIVIITGKGHEKSMNLGHGETAWSDHDAVKKALENRAI